MKRSIEEEGKTVSDAVAKALERLALPEDRVEIEILEEGSKGLFGIFGSKDAKVRVIEKIDAGERAHHFLKDIIDIMDLDVSVDRLENEGVDKGQDIVLNLNGPNLGILIGRRGQTLDALQYLTSVVVNKENEASFQRVQIDAEGYRSRRKKTLENLANRLARVVKEKGRKIVLEPMPPHERRIIHITLRKDPEVKTYSEGREPYRKVVINVKN